MKFQENVNSIEGEMSDEEFQKEIDKETISRKGNEHRYGRDGSRKVYEEKFFYRGFPYWIMINRYFQIGVPLRDIKGMNSISKWAVLEFAEESKPLHDFIETHREFFEISDFLWADTLHSGQEDMTLKEQVEYLHNDARENIDIILDKGLQNIDRVVEDFQKKAEEVKKFLEQIKMQDKQGATYMASHKEGTK